MTYITRILALCGCLLLMGCVDALDLQTSTRDARVDGSYKTYREPWRTQGGGTGETVIHYKVVNIDGQVGVCAAFSVQGDSSIQRSNIDFMRGLQVRVGNEVIFDGVGFARKFKVGARKSSVTAKCRKGRTSWRRGYERGRLRATFVNF